MESHLEARLWNDVFVFAQSTVGLPQGTIRATVLIETISAAFEMDEILYELRDHSAGLNCGRWDYIFSYIKVFRDDPQLVLPDRATVTMDKHFLKSYVELLIKTCHRRGIHAMGGMAAQIPIKNDPAANEAALEKVRDDKLREVKAGHDGTWVAHPGLVPIAKEIFDEHMTTPNQINGKREDVTSPPRSAEGCRKGPRTEAGLRHNMRVSLQYLGGVAARPGCVPLYNLMEDAATAEISRSIALQLIHHGVTLDDGKALTVRALPHRPRGDGLSVQLNKRARRPEKSHWSLVRSSGGMASIITSVDQGFHIAAHDRDGTRSAFPTGPFGSVLRVCERGAIGADEEFPGLNTHGAELLRGVLSCANWRGSDKKAWRRRGRGRSAPDAQRLRGDKASGRQPQREPPRPTAS